MKKINLQKLINLKKELWWELYWFLDSKMNKFYKWNLRREKKPKSPD
jgi:hypothetical protein|tara:strand:- start:152 stop:292 length:141 start_codon:yes stop_codon:yes gene_type:complete